jgi:integrase/transposase-like protein
VEEKVSKQSINAESLQLEVVQTASNKEIKCPRCESSSYWKRGFTEQGEQRYTCKECKHSFYLNAQWKILERDNRIVCPECGSNHYFKRGTTAQGRQQYSCKDCNRHFTKEQIDPNAIVCPRCGVSDYYWKRGFTEQGEQRYTCKECNHGFHLNPQWKILERDSSIVCPECGSNHYFKRGTTAQGKKQYSCKDCNRHFVLEPEWQPLKVPTDFDFDSDVWSAKQIGLQAPIHASTSKFNFSKIRQKWLKINTKRFVLYSAANRLFNSLQRVISTMNDFSHFLEKSGYTGTINDINRSIIVDYVGYLNQKGIASKTQKGAISNLAVFFETGILNRWFSVEPYLIRPEDYARRTKKQPRYIPEEVMLQLNQNLDALPEPIMRMVVVLQECGFRIGELCQLQFNCLKQDTKGHYFVQYWMSKLRKEHTKPISNELAKVIQEQQNYIRDNLGEDFQYLFCGRINDSTKFVPAPKIIKGSSFVLYLKKLAEERDIKDNSGKRWNFQSHQFRHTVGTRMINNGVPQHIVQRYLGHESPEMTMVYAYIHDETLRKEIEKYHETRVVNFQGEAAELEETVLASGDDLEWFKKKVQARALEHGYCARPTMLGDCDIPGFDGCYNCPHWRTNKNFLPVLKDTLERTENVLNKARNCGWELQVKKNEPVKANLQKVIKSLEEAS